MADKPHPEGASVGLRAGNFPSLEIASRRDLRHIHRRAEARLVARRESQRRDKVVDASSWSVFVQGFAINIGLLMTMGAQNIFILRQAITRRHVTTTASVCLAVDTGLIAVGVVGLGGLVAARPWISSVAAWGGAVFILVYALGSLRTALGPQALPLNAGPGGQRVRVAGKAFAVSALNPQVYLDSVIIMGGLAASLAPTHRMGLCCGAISASALWFFGFGYGASFAAPCFRRPATWRVLGMASAGCLLWIAAGLVSHQMATETVRASW